MEQKQQTMDEIEEQKQNEDEIQNIIDNLQHMFIDKVGLLRTELKTFLELLNEDTENAIRRTRVCRAKASYDVELGHVDERTRKANVKWWEAKQTREELFSFLKKRDHNINSTYGNWCYGKMWSRYLWKDCFDSPELVRNDKGLMAWVDTNFNGREVRMFFYSRKLKSRLKPLFDYYLVIDPEHHDYCKDDIEDELLM